MKTENIKFTKKRFWNKSWELWFSAFPRTFQSGFSKSIGTISKGFTKCFHIVKDFKTFKSSTNSNCFEYSEKQIGFSHGTLYNLHVLSNTEQDFLFHIDIILISRANAVIYIHTSKIISNEPGFWGKEPRLVRYATEIRLLRSLVSSQQ